MKERVQELRQWLNLSQNEFAAAINVSPATLSSFFNGHNNPSLKLVYSIKAAYKNVSLDWLLYGTGNMFEGADHPVASAPEKFAPAPAEPDKGLPVQGELFTQPVSTQAEKPAQQTAAASQSRLQRPVQKAPDAAKNLDNPQRRIKKVLIIFDDGSTQTIEG